MRSSFFSNALFLSSAVAQTFSAFQDANGISYWQASIPDATTAGGLELGIALPAESQTAYQGDYLGHVVGALQDGAGWAGISHGGPMTDSLLLIVWPNGNEVMTSFRYATAYTAPDLYTGNATLTQISSSVNSTHFELSYRCNNCWTWDYSGDSGSQIPATTASAVQLMGWVQATAAPSTPDDADTDIAQHQDDGLFGANIASARNTAYTSWMALATATSGAAAGVTAAPTGAASNLTVTAAGNATTTATTAAAASTLAVSCPSNGTIPNTTYDYIVVGSGAGGIALAAKLSEAGHSVLMIERGPPSSGRWGGDMKPAWLAGSNLTRFDVPGLDNEIWEDSNGIACPDVPTMAGCVLGGGTAVNAALWWKANPADFDDNFPAGWKSADMQPAIDRVFDKIPGTYTPSMDNKLYLPQGYDSLSTALKNGGYSEVVANDQPGEKNGTFSHAPFMFSHGERGGPMATYLVEADARSNFKMWTNTTVSRVIRTDSRITGVEVEAYGNGGLCGTVKVTPNTGRVVLSAGAFGTSKILFRSGIGPSDVLDVVKASSDGATMIDESQWINLPVGKNLNDHTSTDIVIHNPDAVFYDFYAAYDTPIAADKNSYLNGRTGILAQSAPNLAPIFWDEITGSDGSVRQFQYTSRIEASHGITSNQTQTITQYLGRGKTSTGRVTMTPNLDLDISTLPYINTAEDKAAIIAGINKVRKAFSNSSTISVVYPAANQTTEDFLTAYPLTVSERTANHWIGTAKMGLDSGLVNNGTSVVDTNTKVYGTDNLFVVDASIFPGMMSNNPSALIVSVAEHASEKILALSTSNSTNVATVSPSASGTAASSSSGSSGFIPGSGSSSSGSTGSGSVGASSGLGFNGTTSAVSPVAPSGTAPVGTAVAAVVSAAETSAASASGFLVESEGLQP